MMTAGWRKGLAAVCWLAAYLALEWVSFIHEYKGLPITPWNPGLGILFACMVRGPAWYGLVLLAGVLLSEVLVVQSALDWPEVAALAAIMAAGYSGAAALARRLRFGVELTRLGDVLVLLGCGVGGAAVVAGSLTGVFLMTGQIGRADIVPAGTPLFIGDAIGIAVATPLLLRLLRPGAGWRSWRPNPVLVVEFALYVAVIAAFLLLTIGAERTGGFNYFYLIFLPIVAAALRHGLDGACASLAVAQVGLVGLMHLHGFDANTFTEYQSLMLVLTATGLVAGVIVSERAQAQLAMEAVQENLKAMEAEAVQAARYNLVTGMASALAHEINQPMTAARALARSAEHLLSTPGGDSRRAADNLADLVAQIDHAGGIVRRMRGFLRRGAPRSSTIDIRNVIEDAILLARASARDRNVAIAFKAQHGLPMMHGDHIQLQQVILNLIHNAVDAIVETGRGSGQIVISASVDPGGDRIVIGVRDDGVGIAPEVEAKLFQPLTTSKPEGLGLGLSISSSIVELHGGRLWLENGTRGATEFRFDLPVSGSEAQQS
jgi:two-component system sensor kinase FixL